MRRADLRTHRPSARRPPARGPVADRIVVTRIEIEIDRRIWVARLTRRHPEIVVEAYNVMRLANGRLLGEYEVRGLREDLRKEIASFPDVAEVELLAEDPECRRYRVQYRATRMFGLEAKHELLVRYPARSRGGWATVDLVGRLSGVRRLVATLGSAGSPIRILSVTRDAFRRHAALTPTQETMFRQALARGYFEVPRRITLTELAQQTSRSKSSVSAILALVERKLAEAA